MHFTESLLDIHIDIDRVTYIAAPNVRVTLGRGGLRATRFKFRTESWHSYLSIVVACKGTSSLRSSNENQWLRSTGPECFTNPVTQAKNFDEQNLV